MSDSDKTSEPLQPSESNRLADSGANLELSVKQWMNEQSSTQTVSQASSPLSDSLSVTIGSLIQTARDNRWAIIIMMLLGCFAGVFKAISETPVYQASLTMAVEPSSRNSRQSLFDPYAYRFYETQYELLKSRSVAARVVDELDLVEREAVDRLLIPPSTLRSLAIEFEKITGVSLGSNTDISSASKLDLSDD